MAKLETEGKADMNVLDARRYVASIALINHAWQPKLTSYDIILPSNVESHSHRFTEVIFGWHDNRLANDCPEKHRTSLVRRPHWLKRKAGSHDMIRRFISPPLPRRKLPLSSLPFLSSDCVSPHRHIEGSMASSAEWRGASPEKRPMTDRERGWWNQCRDFINDEGIETKFWICF